MKNNNRTLNLLLISLLLFSAINTFASNPTDDGFDAQAVDDDSIYLKLFPPVVAIRTPEEGPGADMDIPQNGTSPMKAPFYGTTVPGTDGIINPINPGIGEEKRDDFYDVERIYIGGDAYTAHVVLVKSTKGKGSTTLYRIVRDHVGSIVALVGDGGKVVEENSYDAWGRMRDPDTHEVYRMDKVPGLTLGRGYGSHEYLHRFGLVNMNARLYDPVLGRFALPDPYVQDPTLPQNFNRYSYCLNNPLLYRDPSGEFFIFDDFIIGAFKGFWDAIFHGKNIFKTTWNSGIRHMTNNFNLWKGLFSTDINKSWAGRLNELLLRFTWQLPQTVLGFSYAERFNMYCNVLDVKILYGVTVVRTSNFKGAYTLSNYITGNIKSLFASPDNDLFKHEYGHYIQSQLFGPIYLMCHAPLSIISAMGSGEHNKYWTEKDASSRAFEYFVGNGFYEWNETSHPIYGSVKNYWLNKLGSALTFK